MIPAAIVAVLLLTAAGLARWVWVAAGNNSAEWPTDVIDTTREWR